MKFSFQSQKLKAFKKLTTKEMTYGAIFAASSAAIIIILLTYTPIVTLPTIRIGFEGILIKISGYLFGLTVGFVAGNITEIIINLFRPTFFHWSYYLTIVLYGVLGGLIKHLNQRLKYPATSYFIALLILSAATMVLGLSLINQNDGVNINSFQLSATESRLILYISQGFIIFIMPILYLFANWVMPKYGYLYKELVPIFFLSILTGYFITIPLVPFGDAYSYGQPYVLLVLVAVIQTPINIVVNMIVIYVVWKLLFKFIRKSQSGKYSRSGMQLAYGDATINYIKELKVKQLNISKIFKVSSPIKFKRYNQWANAKLLSKIKIIAITGTNGKGTVAKCLNDYFIYKNKKVGLFLSPHLFKINERISVNNNLINNEEFDELFQRIKPFNKFLNFSFFEYLTLIAMHYFKNKFIDYAIMETGIGAKHDIIGALPNCGSSITSISIDHKKVLGDNVTDIAQNKIYILKDNQWVVVNENHPEILKIYYDYSKKHNGHLININKTFYLQNNYLFINDKKIMSVENLMKHELNNYLIVYKIIKQFFPNDDDVNILKFITKTKLPGRNDQYLLNDKTIYLDVGHNYGAITNYLNELKKKIHKIDLICFSSIKTKEYLKIIAFLKKHQYNFLIFENSDNLSITKEDIEPINMEIFDKNKLQLLLQNDKYKNVIILGSFAFIRDSYKILHKIANKQQNNK